MNEFKHSKHKNIGIIFELLSRQMVSDVLCNKKSEAINIIKRNFRKDSELSKELALYKTIVEFNKNEKSIAGKLLDIVLEQRRLLDPIKLKKEKYNLLGEIKKEFKDITFFTSRISNYKLYASIYKLFENVSSTNPIEYINCYEVIIENITTPPKEKDEITEAMRIWEKQPDEIKQLAFSLVIEKFNTKYKTLNNKQKTLVSKFINENPDAPEFKDYVLKECTLIRKSLDKLTDSIKQPALQIKLKEANNLLDEVITAKFIKEEHLSALLTYYELIETLR